jgi:hypothetical protein
MHYRTKVIAAAAATAAFAAGSVGAAMASTTGGKPPAKHVSANAKGVPDVGLAAQLGVSQARLDHAMRDVKTSLVRGNAKPTEGEFEALLARLLGIPQARVHRAFTAGNSVTKKAARPSASAMAAQIDAMTAAVARESHVSTARATAALRPLFAAGRNYTTSQAIAEAARLLGVSTQQLNTALKHAKQGLAGG